jgi:CCR4-NOT transcription complex subunit 2
MFPTANNTSYVATGQQQQQNQQQQLSPNRSVQMSVIGGGSGSNIVGPPMSTRNNSIFGGTGSGQQQRAFADRRTMSSLGGGGGGPMSNIRNFMPSREYGSQTGNSISNFHNVFASNSNDTGTPPLLDLSEFPSLTNARGGHNEQNLPQANTLQPPGSKPYVGMVKQPTSEQTEFQMSSEDFPALPGTDGGAGVVGSNANSSNQQAITSSAGASSVSSVISANNIVGGLSGNQLSADSGTNSMNMMENKNSLCMDMMQSNDNGSTSSTLVSQHHVGSNSGGKKSGVQTSPNGLVTNIPASMVNNQFGMVGLLTFIRAAESDPNLVSLAMGQDLTALGLNLNSMDNLYQSFGGPFSDCPARPQDIDYPVPAEYLINMSIRDKLAQMKLKQYKDDLLFFLFYTNVGDVMQIAAANELYQRDWRFHIEEKVWITRVPGNSNYDKIGTTERGSYIYFDAQNWRRVHKEYQAIDTQKLDKNPTVNLS